MSDDEISISDVSSCEIEVGGGGGSSARCSRMQGRQSILWGLSLQTVSTTVRKRLGMRTIPESPRYTLY